MFHFFQRVLQFCHEIRQWNFQFLNLKALLKMLFELENILSKANAKINIKVQFYSLNTTQDLSLARAHVDKNWTATCIHGDYLNITGRLYNYVLYIIIFVMIYFPYGSLYSL